jgi:hypothetical protein
MATYRGPTQADVLRQFTADSERARAAGYTPVSQAWAQENGEEVMRVRFARTEGATPPPPVIPPPPAAAPSWGAPSAAGSGSSSSGSGLRTAIIVGAVIVLALAGLGAIGLANSPQPSEALATSTPSAVARATPTRAPSPSPAATAASGGNAGTAADKWIEFAGWVGATMPTLADEANALAAAANAGDVDGVVEQANKIEDTTNEILDYLDSHPPADCYADVHYATRSAIDEYRTAAVAAGKKDFDTAASHMDDANKQINKLPDMLTGTDCLS